MCHSSCCRLSSEMLNSGTFICTHGMLFQCLCSTQPVLSLVCLFYKVVWSDDWICHGIFSPSRRPLIHIICFPLSFVSLFLDGIWRGGSLSFQTGFWMLRSCGHDVNIKRKPILCFFTFCFTELCFGRNDNAGEMRRCVRCLERLWLKIYHLMVFTSISCFLI